MDAKTRDKRPSLRLRLIILGVVLLVFLALLCLRWHFSAVPAAGEQYARGAFFSISAPFRFLSQLLPFSLTECCIVLLLPLLLLFWLIRLIRRRKWPHKALGFFCFLLTLSIAACLFGSIFLLHFGLNYAREPLNKTLGIEVQSRPGTSLETAFHWLIREQKKTRALLTEDEDGVVKTMLSSKVILDRAFEGYQAAADFDPVFAKGKPVKPKAFLLSKPLSYTGIGGIYNPFFAEANVNVDLPAFIVPFNALHEIAHVQGYAREDEANFLAFLTGICHPLPEFRYASLTVAVIYVGERLAEVDRPALERASMLMTDGMKRDLANYKAYWRSFAGPIQRLFRSVNDSFLRVNQQADGVYSYGRMIDLLLGFHERYGDLDLETGVFHAR